MLENNHAPITIFYNYHKLNMQNYQLTNPRDLLLPHWAVRERVVGCVGPRGSLHSGDGGRGPGTDQTGSEETQRHNDGSAYLEHLIIVST